MNTDNWIVKKAGGEEFGSIRKLIIDSNTRELSYADVMLAQTNELVRLPWTELDVRHEGIFLKPTHLPVENDVNAPSHPGSLDVLDIPIKMAGKIGHSRRALSSSSTSSKLQA
ncbi:hypothetical protein [Nitrospira sp. Nam74]